MSSSSLQPHTNGPAAADASDDHAAATHLARILNDGTGDSASSAAAVPATASTPAAAAQRAPPRPSQDLIDRIRARRLAEPQVKDWREVR